MKNLTLSVFLVLFLGLSIGAIADRNIPTSKPQLLQGQKTSRGYITHRIESAPGGAFLTVEVVQDRKNSKVRLTLARDGTSGSPGSPNWVLTHGVTNGTGYLTRFKFFLHYQKLHLQSGRQMVVIANFPSGHRWGGTDRGGALILPREKSRVAKEQPTPPETIGFGEGVSVTSLDVAQPIDRQLALEFSSLRGRGGLEVGGQVRSRVEAEGKFQLTESSFLQSRQLLFSLASDQRLARDILGPEWSIKVETRYMQKNRLGNLIYDDEGLPIPDPMIDTYYDNRNHDAAKNDIAIRYRWTEGNQTGAWNFKPGAGRLSPDGIVYRVEYGVDTTDDRPSSIKVFANSNHPLNPFQLLREVVPNSTPGSFFEPSVRIHDTRYKFILSHSSGISIEVSLDKVLAERLGGPRKRVAFYQLEMDIEHVATEIKSAPVRSSDEPRALLHTPRDTAPTSPTLETGKETFDLSTEVIIRLRNFLLGKAWVAGAQKYAYAAAALGMIRNISPTVKRVKCADILEEK